MPEFVEENWLALISAIVALVSLWYVRKSALAALTSASASKTSAQTAEDALKEAQRQYLRSITPSVTAAAEQMREVPGAVRPGGLLKVIVNNAGPGLARNIRGRIEVTIGTTSSGGEERKAHEVQIAQLPPGGSHTIDARGASSRPRDVTGLLTYEDSDSRKHWSHCPSPSDDWQFGEGDPPERSTT